MFKCEQCEVWGYDRPVMTMEEAELHLLYVHPLRFHRVFKTFVAYGDNAGTFGKFGNELLRDELTHALRARRE